MNINLPTPLPSDIQVSPTSYPLKVNGSSECLSFVTGDLLTIFQIGSLTQRFQRSFGRVPILAEVLAKTNIVALVFSADPHTLLIWDDHQSIVIKELTSPSPIVNLHFIGPYLLLVNLQSSILYRIEDFQLIHKEITGNNPNGLADLKVNQASDYQLVVPSPEIGHVIISQSESQVSFQAHQNPLSALTINSDASLIATASERGTIIRIWSCKFQNVPQKIQEFRRGAEVTTIHSLNFHPNPDINLLAVTGKTKTTHLFTWDFSDAISKPNKVKSPRLSESSESAKSLASLPAGAKPTKQRAGRPWWNQAWSVVRREIPNYLSSQGSLIQIPSPKNCLVIFHPDRPELVLISPSGQLVKYLYQLEPPETRQILALQLN